MEALFKEPTWTFSLNQIRRTTISRKDSYSFDQELILQSKGVQFITRMAGSLRLPTHTIFASALFLHRYYIRHSLKRTHPYQIASACVFLACKTEESPRKLKEVAAVATKAALKLPSQVTIGEIEAQNAADIEQWTRVIKLKEDELLQALKFDFEDTTPYEHLNKLVRSYVSPEDHQLLGSAATLFLNDSCLTMVGLTCHMPHLAVAALYWASKSLKMPIPAANGEKWYISHLSRPEIVQIINDMVEMITIVRGVNKMEGQKYEKIA